MITEIYEPNDLKKAGEVIRKGGLIAFPTETVYGLGANAFDPKAVLNIFKAKMRPADNPLIVHIKDVDEIDELCINIPEQARILADAFWPGPLTMVMPKRDIIPKEVSAGLDTVGIRFPSNPIAQELIRQAGVPIAAPSANLSGKPSTTSFDHVYNDMNGRVDGIIRGGESDVGLESTVVEFENDIVRILRPGYITLENIESVLGEGSVEVAEGIMQKLELSGPVRSPGMKYRHYAPAAPVYAVCGEPADIAREIKRRVRDAEGAAVIICEEYADKMPCRTISVDPSGDYAAEAHMLFDALRQLDTPDIKVIYAQCPPEKGIGLAVANRLKRAAAFNVIEARKYPLIGLTGPTGAGKGVVSQAFCDAGAYVIDCDEFYHHMLDTDAEMLAVLNVNFPDAFVGGFDRKALGRIVLADFEKLQKLNSIVHPFITKRILEHLESLPDGTVAVLDAPTLIESGLDTVCDSIVSVLAPSDIRMKRIIERDGLDEAYAMSRIKASKPDEYYAKRSDTVIVNEGALEAIKIKSKEIANNLIQEVKYGKF